MKTTVAATTYLRTKRRETSANRLKLTVALVTLGAGVALFWITRE